ncbi:MAG: ribosome maturation factor RimP [Bacteroidetes bacterium]|nr:ribosome maturation factor RimP [Bacteroidota bacterium]
MDLKEKIKELTLASLSNPAHFLVDVIVSKHKPMKFTVILDGDSGITIDDCALVSRGVNSALENLIEVQYSLEISTPGLDHPLKLKRQYEKNKGRKLKVHLTNKSIVLGVLQQVEEEKIVIEAELKEGLPAGQAGKKIETRAMEIPFAEIEKAFVTVSFK